MKKHGFLSFSLFQFHYCFIEYRQQGKNNYKTGIILIIVVFINKRDEFIALTTDRHDLRQSILAGIGGTMMLQFTFFGTVQRFNAGTATVLQYLCPVITVIYVCLHSHKKPTAKELIAIIMALSGIYFVSTHGNIHELVMTPEGIAWGLACAFRPFSLPLFTADILRKS